MELELYYYDTCPFCQIVFSTIDQLEIRDKITYKNIYERPEYMQELIDHNGHRQVPCLVIDRAPLLESADINAFLTSQFGSES